MMLTMDAVVTEIKQEKKAPAASSSYGDEDW